MTPTPAEASQASRTAPDPTGTPLPVPEAATEALRPLSGGCTASTEPVGLPGGLTAALRRRWASLNAEQLAVAEDLHARAVPLLAADPELTAAEAFDTAAIEGGYRPITKPRSDRREFP